MKKLLQMKTMLLLCALIVGSGSVWAADETITFSDLGYSNGSEVTTVNGTNFQIYFNKGTNNNTPKYYDNNVAIPAVRVYGGGYMTVSSDTKNIIKIELTFGSGDGSNSISTDKGTFSSSTWTGNATSVKFTVGGTSGNRRFASVAVTYESSGEATSVTIDDSGITNTDIADGTDAGSFAATVKDASSQAIEAATVTWSSSNTAVATINATTGAVELVKKGTTTITASYAGVDGTYQSSSATYDLTVDNSNAGDGTSAKPFKPSEAIDALNTPGEIVEDTEYYVAGIVSQVGSLSDNKLTYYISDDGTSTNQLQCYKGLGLDGAYFESADDLEVGDKVTVKGKLTIYGFSTPEFKEGSVITSLSQRTKVNILTFTADAATLVVGETTNTAVTNDVPAWTPASYTYTSDDETVATVDATGKITAVKKGTANITVAPNIAVDDENYKVGDSKSIEIIVKNPNHDVVFLVNGEDYSSASVEEGEDIEFPAVNPSAIGSKVFFGWSAVEVEITDDEPEIVTSAKMGNADVTYYAVFATVSGSTITKTDVLNQSFTGRSGTSYGDWSNKLGSDSDAKYAGNTAGGNSSIQLRSTNSSGIISTTSGGKVKKVTVEWNSNTAEGRTLDIYGSNKAYTAASNLYSDATKGTLLGSIIYNNGESTELTITGDYAYVGLRSRSNAMYLDEISIDWEVDNRTYSAYTTTVTETVSTNADRYYGSYVTTKKLDFKNAEGITAYIAKGFNNAKNAIVLQEVDVVPAGTAIIVKTDEKGGSADVEVTTDDASDVSENALVAGDGTTAYNGTDGYTYYYLASDLFHKATSGTLKSGKAYLKVANGDVPEARSFGFVFDDEEATGINTVAKDAENGQFFNLAGQRVAQPTKGLYIVNGRKVIVK